MVKKINKKEATIIELSEFLPIFYEAITYGFNDYFKSMGSKTINYRPTTRANVIFDNIISRLKQILAGHGKVTFHHKNGMISLLIANRYLIKFKKLNENLKSSNVRTKQNSLFLGQQSLFGLEPIVSNLEVGYVLNRVDSEIEGVYMVCPKGDKANEWEFDVGEYLQKKSRLTLFDNTPVNNTKPKKRFKIKKNKGDNNEGEKVA